LLDIRVFAENVQSEIDLSKVKTLGVVGASR